MILNDSTSLHLTQTVVSILPRTQESCSHSSTNFGELQSQFESVDFLFLNCFRCGITNFESDYLVLSTNLGAQISQ